MRAIRARYNPYMQTRHRIEQVSYHTLHHSNHNPWKLQQLGHSCDKVEFIIMGGTFMCLSEDYRDYFIRYAVSPTRIVYCHLPTGIFMMLYRVIQVRLLKKLFGEFFPQTFLWYRNPCCSVYSIIGIRLYFAVTRRGAKPNVSVSQLKQGRTIAWKSTWGYFGSYGLSDPLILLIVKCSVTGVHGWKSVCKVCTKMWHETLTGQFTAMVKCNKI